MAKIGLTKLRQFFILKKIGDYKKIAGWLTQNEALGLYLTAGMLPAGAVIVEIGSWQGKSTFCLAKGLRSGKIYAIDPFNADAGFDMQSSEVYTALKGTGDLLAIFNGNMKNFIAAKNIVVKKGYSEQFANDFDFIDFLFIDGDHSIAGCKKDYQLYAGKVRKGGFIAFHDYYPDRPELGPTYVINELVKKSDEFVFYKQLDSLWIAVKR
jgi:predicted O-methyltransferase YrrM